MQNMLKGNLNVFPYNTFTTADKLFTRHPIWLQAKIESDKMVFEEYVAESRQRKLVCIVSKPFLYYRQLTNTLSARVTRRSLSQRQ